MVSNSFCAPGVTLIPILSAARRFCSKAVFIFLSSFSTSTIGSDCAGFVDSSITSRLFIRPMFSILMSVTFFLVFFVDSTTY